MFQRLAVFVALQVCFQFHSIICLAASEDATLSALQAIRETAVLENVEARRLFREMGSEVAREYAAFNGEEQGPYRENQESMAFRLRRLLIITGALIQNQEELIATVNAKQAARTSLESRRFIFGGGSIIGSAASALILLNTSAHLLSFIVPFVGGLCIVLCINSESRLPEQLEGKFEEDNKQALAVRFYMTDFWQGFAEYSPRAVPDQDDESHSLAYLHHIFSYVTKRQQKLTQQDPEVVAGQLRAESTGPVANESRCEEVLGPGVATQSQRRGA